MAAATASQANLATGVSSKGIMALGATGIGAAFVCIAALVVMLGNKDPDPEQPSPAVRRAPVHRVETQSTTAPALAPASTRPTSGSSASPVDESQDVRGEVSVGKGKVRDRGQALWERGQSVDLGYDNHRDTQRRGRTDSGSTAASVGSERQRGRVVKHGPAVLAPKDAGTQPLMRPNLDMQAVERELYGGN
jgi:hypothetical protein